MELTQLELFSRLGVSLVIGMLIGLQREYHQGTEKDDDYFAGARTFTLLCFTGSIGAYLSLALGTHIILIAIILAVGALITIAYFLGGRDGDLGLTTEIAALLTVIIGALCIVGSVAVAAASAVAVTVLLAIKIQMKSLAQKLTREDVYSTLKFAVISIIVLPLLPKEGFGPPPFNALAPFKIWLMVVFISGISFLGYILIKIVGARRGVGLTGILGGLASSTAVTLSFSQRSRDTQGLSRSFALAILLAWSVMFIRVMVETAAINPALFKIVWIPMTAATIVTFCYCVYLYVKQVGDQPEQGDNFTNPFRLKPAVTFGILYAVIFLVANAAKIYFGDTGVYVSSIVSGLADVDAITLSMAELSRVGSVELSTAARAVVLAAASNTLVKGAIVLSAGSPELRKVILPGIIASVVTAIGVVFLL